MQHTATIPLTPVNITIENEVDSSAVFPFWFNTIDQVIDSSSLGIGRIYMNSTQGSTYLNLNSKIRIVGPAYHLNVLPMDAEGIKNLRLQNIGSTETSLSNNVYYDSTAVDGTPQWRYILSNTGSVFQESGNDFYMTSFASGTQGNVATVHNWLHLTGSTGAINLGAYTGSITGTPATMAVFDASGNLLQTTLPGGAQSWDATLTVNPSTAQEATITGTSTAHPLFDVGGFHVQPTAVNDILLNDNAQAVSGTLKYITNGYSEGFELYNGQISARAASSGTAGGNITNTIPWMIDNTNGGSAYLGANISYGGGSGAAATFTGTKILFNAAMLPAGATGDSAIVGNISSGVLTLKAVAQGIPTTNVTFDLGTSSLAWRDIYLSHTVGESAIGVSIFT